MVHRNADCRDCRQNFMTHPSGTVQGHIVLPKVHRAHLLCPAVPCSQSSSSTALTREVGSITRPGFGTSVHVKRRRAPHVLVRVSGGTQAHRLRRLCAAAVLSHWPRGGAPARRAHMERLSGVRPARLAREHSLLVTTMGKLIQNRELPLERDESEPDSAAEHSSQGLLCARRTDLPSRLHLML
uniref:Uncharacterized protein n=1 Tax=Eutreptiella gymnastica TaxID=73025 RepID=A0A7S4CBP4_9EUGL